MQKQKVIISAPIAIAGISLVLVIRSTANCQPLGDGIFFSGVKQPVNLLVASPAARKAFTIDGLEISPSKLLEENPDLSNVLETI